MLAQLAGLNAWAWQQRNALAERRLAMVQLLRSTHPQVRAVHQGDRHLQLNGAVNLRDMTELMPDSTRRPIQPGDWWEFDDMSLNQPFWFDCDPEDFQGDPMAQRYRRSLGRQQSRSDQRGHCA